MSLKYELGWILSNELGGRQCGVPNSYYISWVELKILDMNWVELKIFSFFYDKK